MTTKCVDISWSYKMSVVNLAVVRFAVLLLAAVHVPSELKRVVA